MGGAQVDDDVGSQQWQRDKHFDPERNRIRLEPANSNMKPIYVKDASVVGIVVGVVRKV